MKPAGRRYQLMTTSENTVRLAFKLATVQRLSFFKGFLSCGVIFDERNFTRSKSQDLNNENK